MRSLILAAAMLVCGSAQAMPNGTVLMMYADNVLGKVAQRVTGDKYTHVAIVLNGWVYEADFPRVEKNPLLDYGSFNTHIYAYYPKRPYTRCEVQRMVRYAEAHLGQRYSLKNYFRPRARRDRGTWCSMYVKDVLNRSCRYRLGWNHGYEPQNLLNAIRRDYVLAGRLPTPR